MRAKSCTKTTDISYTLENLYVFFISIKNLERETFYLGRKHTLWASSQIKPCLVSVGSLLIMGGIKECMGKGRR